MGSRIIIKREFSAGAVVFKGSKVLLGKHSGYHKWVLPKGLIEKGEKGVDTALRETEEEMGVKAKLASDKPIHRETYIYYADFKVQPEISKSEFLNSKQIPNSKLQNEPTRRVLIYQEQGGDKVKVFKTVTFYLAEYVSGDPSKHGWEMEEAGWYDYQDALNLMSFEGEKEALVKAMNYFEKKI